MKRSSHLYRALTVLMGDGVTSGAQTVLCVRMCRVNSCSRWRSENFFEFDRCCVGERLRGGSSRHSGRVVSYASRGVAFKGVR